MSRSRTNGLGISGGVLGIILLSTGLFLMWQFWYVYALVALLGIVLSAIGLAKGVKHGASIVMAVIGLSTSVIVLGLMLLFMIFFISVLTGLNS